MHIIQTVDAYRFADEFRRMGREKNFSYEGLMALFRFLQDLAEDTGAPIELDVIALSSEFSEHKTAKAAARAFGWERGDGNALTWLHERTSVIEFEGGVLVSIF